MTNSSEAPIEHCHCPRCGYDLRGTAATWEDAGACPLEGTCTEYGYVFLWRDVLRPTFGEPAWCVEYAPIRVRSMLRAILTTFLRSWLPWSFWRRLRLHHEVRLHRIGLYLLAVAILPCAVIYVVSQTAAALIVRSNIQQFVTVIPASPETMSAMKEQLARWRSFRNYASVPLEERRDALEMAAFPIDTLIDEGERFDPVTHIPNPLDWGSYWLRVVEMFEQQIDFHAALQQNPPRVEFSPVISVLEAIAQPLSDKSSGTVSTPYGNEPYPPPRDLYMELLNTRSGWAGWKVINRLDRAVEFIRDVTTAWLIVMLSYPFMFVMLPITRRRMRVRWIHCAHIATYSAFIPIVIVQISSVCLLACFYWPGAAERLTSLAMNLPTFGLPVLLLIWWYCAIRLHLRLPNALAVTLILAILNVLVVVGAAFLMGSALFGL